MPGVNIRCSTRSACPVFIWMILLLSQSTQGPPKVWIWAPSGASQLRVATSRCASPPRTSSRRSRHHHVPALAHGCALTGVDDELFNALVRVPDGLGVQAEAGSYVLNVWPDFAPALRGDTTGDTETQVNKLPPHHASTALFQHQEDSCQQALVAWCCHVQGPQAHTKQSTCWAFFPSEAHSFNSASSWLQEDNILLTAFSPGHWFKCQLSY